MATEFMDRKKLNFTLKLVCIEKFTTNDLLPECNGDHVVESPNGSSSASPMVEEKCTTSNGKNYIQWKVYNYTMRVFDITTTMYIYA